MRALPAVGNKLIEQGQELPQIQVSEKNINKATELVRQAIDQINQIKDPNEKGIALSKLADRIVKKPIFLKDAQLTLLLGSILRAADKIPQAHHLSAVFKFAEFCQQQKNPHAAVALYEQALQVAEKMDNPEMKKNALRTIVTNIEQMFIPAESPLYEKTVQIEYKALLNLEKYLRGTDPEKAVTLYTRIVDFVCKKENAKIILAPFKEKGLSPADFSKDLLVGPLLREIGEGKLLPWHDLESLLKVAELLQQNENPDRAKHLYAKIVQAMDKLEGSLKKDESLVSIAKSLNKMARACHQQNDYKEMKDFYESALKVTDRIKETRKKDDMLYEIMNWVLIILIPENEAFGKVIQIKCKLYFLLKERFHKLKSGREDELDTRMHNWIRLDDRFSDVIIESFSETAPKQFIADIHHSRRMKLKANLFQTEPLLSLFNEG